VIETRTAFCRLCTAYCPILVEVEQGRALRVIGDRESPEYLGYTCAKGRALPEYHNSDERLLHPLKRVADGRYQSLASERALDEIAERLQRILDRDGPRAVALYTGIFAAQAPTFAVASAWLQAVGSGMHFTTGSIDQPGKLLAPALHGRWRGGEQVFDDSDTWLFVGTNPTVSKLGGISFVNPDHRLHKAVQRGARLVVVDPRRTELAAKADIHLQPRPGEDPTLLAGMIRVILSQELYDAEFVAENARGLETLRERVEPFTPEYVERRADVPAQQLIEAARVWARARRGGASAGTGSNMAPRGTLTEYLLLCLMTLCGRWLREGEQVPNPGVLVPTPLSKAQPAAPFPAWGFEPKLRVRGLGNAMCGLQTGALADEILMQGEGQIKALICIGGNPMMAWPDQLLTAEALQALELCVTVDPRMTATARLSDYVIPPKLMLETPGISFAAESLGTMGVAWGYTMPYGRYAPPAVDPPETADLIENWEFFYGLAQRMGLPLRMRCGATFSWPGDSVPAFYDLDMQHKPTTWELMEKLTQGSRISLAEVETHPHGGLFEDPSIVVLPRDPDCEDRLELANEFMMAALEEVSRESLECDSGFSHLLVSRRIPNVFNSVGRDVSQLTRHGAHNPAFINPDDLDALGLASGDIIEIRSARASILGVAEAAPDVRPGVISMAHAFGDIPGQDDDVRALGGNTGRLCDARNDTEPYTGIPRMSAIPVNIDRH